MVVAHVLIDGQRDAGGVASVDGLERFGVVHAERFLSEDTFDDLASAGGFDEAQLRVGGHGDIEHFDGWIV